MATKDLGFDNFYSSTLSSGISASDTVIPVNAAPTASEGYLVLDQDNSSKEIIYYTSKTSNSVTCPSAVAGRGLGGTSAASHSSNATIKSNAVAEMFEALQSGDAMGAGTQRQKVGANFSAVATGTTVMVYDDTKPQNTEGIEFMTQAITPKAATNTLYIRATVFVSHSAANTSLIGALFQDSTADAIAVDAAFAETATTTAKLLIEHKMTAGTTSAITFKVRAGGDQAGTTTFNGNAGVRKFGGITLSNITITETQA